jgi:hypothetical protein
LDDPGVTGLKAKQETDCIVPGFLEQRRRMATSFVRIGTIGPITAS